LPKGKEDVIKTGLKEVSCEGRRLMELAQDRVSDEAICFPLSDNYDKQFVTML
jgi:hypothetical protein